MADFNPDLAVPASQIPETSEFNPERAVPAASAPSVSSGSETRTTPAAEPTFSSRLGGEKDRIKDAVTRFLGGLEAKGPVLGGRPGGLLIDPSGEGSMDPRSGVKPALRGAAAVGDAALGMASGALTGLAGGVAGAGRTGYALATGDAPGEALQRGADVVNAFTDKAYSARTDGGRLLTAVAGAPIQALKSAGETLGGSVGRVLGDEAAGETIGGATGELALLPLGLRRAPQAIRDARASLPRVLDQKSAAIKSMIEDGFSVMPSTGASPKTGKLVTTVGKKSAVENRILLENQANIQRLAKEELGLPPAAYLDETAFLNQRRPHYAVYDEFKNLPFDLTLDPQIKTAIRDLSRDFETIQTSFPEYRVPAEVSRTQALVLNAGDTISPRAVVELVKTLREDARHDLSRVRSISAEEKRAALIKIEAANELESLVSRGVARRAQTHHDVDPNLLDRFERARREIAKSHNVQEATNLQTGTINPETISNARARGTKLTGNLEKIANARDTAPDVVKRVDGIIPESTAYGDAGWGGLGAGVSALASGHFPVVAAGALSGMALRPGARALASSRAFQNSVVKPSPAGRAPIGLGDVVSLDAAAISAGGPAFQMQDEPAADR